MLLSTTRFAPSPTGSLHIGHAYAALTAWRLAGENADRFLLRIEDIDAGRCRPEFVAAIFNDLGWLGVRWSRAPRMQSEHLPDYHRALGALERRSLVYPCFCSRADVAAALAAPHQTEAGATYPGTCRDLSATRRAERIASGLPYALRLDMTRALAAIVKPLDYFEYGEGLTACRPERFGDVVLGRKDSRVSYHLCVTHDDALQGVGLVSRGADLRPATDLHRLLQALMGWGAPIYAHHRVLTDATGRRLSKRDGAVAIGALRKSGHSPADVRAMAGLPDHPPAVTPFDNSASSGSDK